MRFRYTVDIEVERVQGKFASRDELGEQLEQALLDADPGSVEGENGGEYEVTGYEVAEAGEFNRALADAMGEGT